MSDELELLRRACGGDDEALAALLRAAAPAVRRALAGRVPAHLRSLLSEEDVLQQTFADAFLEIDGFVPVGEGAFSAWLARMARNNLLDAVRALEAEKRGGGRRAVRAVGSDGPGDDGRSAELLLDTLLASSVTSPSRGAARGEAREILDAALRRLPAEHERVVRLLDLDGRGVREVAGLLDRSPGAVHLLRHRALRRLQGLLGASERFFGDSA